MISLTSKGRRSWSRTLTSHRPSATGHRSDLGLGNSHPFHFPEMPLAHKSRLLAVVGLFLHGHRHRERTCAKPFNSPMELFFSASRDCASAGSSTGMADEPICRLVHNLRCRVLPRPARHLLLEQAFSRATRTRVLIWTERGCPAWWALGRSGLDIADAVQGVPSPTEAYLNLNSAHHPRLLP